MKKTLLLLFLFATSVLSAQNVVNIQYSDSDDPVWKLYAKAQNCHYMRVTLSGDFSGKTRYRVFQNVCRDGHITTQKDVLPERFYWSSINDSIITIDFLSYPVTPDSVKIVTDNSAYDISKSMEFASGGIFMETLSEEPYTTWQEIPFIAYTSGIIEPIVIEGKSYDAQKFCKLRDMKLHPIKWKEIEGVSDYIYFSIIFQ